MYKIKNKDINEVIYRWRKKFSNSIRKFEPLIAKFCDLNLKNSKMLKHEDELYFKKSLFDKIPSISIDVAVMERSNNIQCKTLNCGWTDIGSWDKYFEGAAR